MAKRRARSARPSRRRRAGGSPPIQRIVAVVLLFLAAITGVSLIPRASGPIPERLSDFAQSLFGLHPWMLPTLLFLIGLVFLVAKRPRLTRRLGGLLLVWLTLLFAEHIHLGDVAIGREMALGLEGHGGGAVGGLVANVWRRLLGPPGPWVGISVTAMAAFFLLTGVGPLRALEWLAISFLRAVAAVGRAMPGVTHLVGATLGALATLVGNFVAGIVAAIAALLGRLQTKLARRRAASPPVKRRMTATVKPAAAAREVVLASGPETPYVTAAPEPLLPVAASAAPASARDEAATAAQAGTSAARAEAPRRPRSRGSRQESLGLENGATVEAPAAPGAVPAAAAAGAPGSWTLPSIEMLQPAAGPRGKTKLDPAEVARNLEAALGSFGVEVKCLGWEQGPVVTRFELLPAPGVKVQKITSLTNDIALALAAQSVRIEAPIPGKSAVGIELPNEKAALVALREILETPEFRRPDVLRVALGKDIAGYPVTANLVEMPHLLIAGATGSGKSVALNTIVASLLVRATPDHLRFVMIDPKRVELTHYESLPHLLIPVVKNAKDAAAKLRKIIAGMERRYEVFAQAMVRNIQGFNQLPEEERKKALEAVLGDKLGETAAGALCFVVLIIDELADLMMVAPAEFEDAIVRLAQMARATGIHLVVATQRPSVDVITGLIKANIPSRIAFAVSSMVDSRTILDAPGAEKLLGRGDMLYLPIGANRATRVQGAYVSDKEIERLVDFWKDQGAPAFEQTLLEAKAPEESEEGEDELLGQAARIIVQTGYGSVSLLQRKMKIGYVRAARIVDQLEARGIVGPSQGSNPREVLMGVEDVDRMFAASTEAGRA